MLSGSADGFREWLPRLVKPSDEDLLLNSARYKLSQPILVTDVVAHDFGAG